IRNIQSIKLYGAEYRRYGVWLNKFVDTLNSSYVLGHKINRQMIVQDTSMQVDLLITIFICAQLYFSGSISVGAICSIIVYKRLLLASSNSLIDIIFKIKIIGIYLERLSDILVERPEVNEAHQSLDNIHFDTLKVINLSYSYPGCDAHAINNINLEINRGQSCVLRGMSGTGKTTLLKCIAKINNGYKGNIFINDIDYMEISRKSINSVFSVVMQNDKLLTGNIIDNITFFSESPDYGLVKKCARYACIHEELMNLPMQYESRVGDLGSGLSAGQEQRILI